MFHSLKRVKNNLVEFHCIIRCPQNTPLSSFFVFSLSPFVLSDFSSTLGRLNQTFVKKSSVSSKNSPVLSPFTRQQNLTEWPRLRLKNVRLSTHFISPASSLLTLITAYRRTKNPFYLFPLLFLLLSLVLVPLYLTWSFQCDREHHCDSCTVCNLVFEAYSTVALISSYCESKHLLINLYHCIFFLIDYISCWKVSSSLLSALYRLPQANR